MAILTVHVVEIGMVLPDVVCMVVRDQEPEYGKLLQLSSPDSGTYGSNVNRDPVTGGPGSEPCMIVGQLNGVKKMFLKFYDKKPTAYLDRAVVDVAANWATIGGRTVTNVYRKSRAYGQCNGANGYNTVTMEHHLFLKLNGVLAQGGPYTISVAGNTFPATPFTFNDRKSRSAALRTTQTGHRAAEKVKYAMLSQWIPGYGTEGRVDYSAYTTAELIDVNDVTVYSAPLTLMINATDLDPTDLTSGATANYNYSSTIGSKVATAAAGDGTKVTITINAHGYATGDKKVMQGFAGLAIDGLWTITVTGANTFTIPSTATGTWSYGTYLPGYSSLVHNVWSGNRWATNVYKFDFSGFSASDFPGKYRVRVAGIGVSDEFTMMEHTRLEEAKAYMKGIYNQLTGMALSASVGGWDRPAAHRDGSNAVEIYESICPGSFNHEAFSNNPYQIGAAVAGCSTISFDVALITGNVINGSVNGTAFPAVTYTSSSANTLLLLCNSIKTIVPAAEVAVTGTQVAAYNTIGNGAPLSTRYTFTGVTVTGGASQPNVKMSQFLRSARETRPFVTYRDAGDWDWHNNWNGAENEGMIAYNLLEYAYRWLPASKRDLHLGFPKATALDASFYAGTDNLGDQFHMAVYSMDSYRVTQKPDGRVCGGMNYSFITTGSGDKGGGYSQLEPSQYSPFVGFLLDADPNSNFVYATAAAKIAQVLLEAGFTTAGNAWKTSAVNAYKWANDLHLDYIANGPNGAALTAYFGTTLGIIANGASEPPVSFFYSTPAVWTAVMNAQFGLAANTNVRAMAAGMLYHLTGSTAYGAVFDAVYTTGSSGSISIGAWEYCQADNVATDYPGHSEYLNSRWLSESSVPTKPFETIMHALLYSPQTQNNQYAQWQQEKMNYSLGVNQEMRTRVSGVGYRPIQNPLIRDREAMGLHSSTMPGTVVYFHFAGQHGYLGSLQGPGESPINYTMTGLTGVDPIGWTKVLTPFPTQRPYEESCHDNTYAINHCEYIVAQPIVQHFIMAVIAHCFDGNDVSAPVTGKYVRRLACAA